LEPKDSPQLWARISTLFFERCATDKEMLYILEKEGYKIGEWSLRNIRKKLGLNRRVYGFTASIGRRWTIELICVQKLVNCTLENYEKTGDDRQEWLRSCKYYIPRQVILIELADW
jgi:hypothetical protein